MTEKTNIVQTLIEIQDYLVPILDTYEQALYHYILRYTLLVGKRTAVISIKTANIGLLVNDEHYTCRAEYIIPPMFCCQR